MIHTIFFRCLNKSKSATSLFALPALAITIALLATATVLATDGMHFDGSGRETPWTNCTVCHGDGLTGSIGPSCMDCHSDFTAPDPPAAGHHFPGREDPTANNCTVCHGSELDGDIGPSCFSCHDQLWTGGGGGNSPPVIHSGGPYAGTPGVPLTFDASGTTDVDGDGLIYLWGFGDGTQPSFPSQVPTITHTYADAGTYTAMLSVTDGVNMPEIVDVVVVIEDGTTNLPPSVDPGDSYSGIAGQPTQFDGSGTTDPEDDDLEYQWDFGDGNSSQSSQSPLASHTYAGAGTYTVTLSVSDGFNNPVSEQTDVVVEPPNLPPFADAGGPYSGVAGTSVTLNAGGSFDPDGDTLNYVWTFGDGSPPVSSPNATASHTYTNAGNYSAILTVSDGVNAPVSDQVNVEVTDDSVPPPAPTGDAWNVRLPLLAAEGTVEFDHFAGFLFVKETFDSCGSTVYGIGLRFGAIVFWMDSKGSLFMGSQDGATMVGLVFNFMGNGNSIWFAEDRSAGVAPDTQGLFDGGLFGFF